MSLFRSCDWWEVSNHGQGISYDIHSLVVDSLAGEDEEAIVDQVVTVSMSGLVQIHQPSRSPGGGARAEDLLLEQQLAGGPVCGVDTGQLVPGQTGRQLAILHPRSLAVYQLSRRQGSGSQGDSYVLSLAYQHTLMRSAYAITKGPFGGAKSRDYLAVLSLDGTLSIFEQETHTFSRFLPGFLVPGPLLYVDRSDSFLVASSSYSLDSFKYQALAIAGEGGAKQESQNISTGKRIVADWRFEVGEPILQMQVIRSLDKDEPDTIITLARQTLLAVLDNGGLLWTKRLEFSPRCLLAHSSMIYDKRIISMVCSDSGTLMFYDNTTLKWASQLGRSSPVSVRRGKFWDKETSRVREGMVVSLTEEGGLSVTFLGTQPTIFSAPPPDSREVNYEETDAELARLSAIIKANQTSGSLETNSSQASGLRVSVSVSSQLEICRYPECELLSSESAVPMVAVTLSLHTTSPLTKVRLTLVTVPPIGVSRPSASFSSLTGTDSLTVHAFLVNSSIVSSLDMDVVVTYINTQGVPNCVKKTVTLPLSLAIKPCPPIKDADFKVTLSTNKPAVSLLDLFPEFVLDSSMTNAAGFQQYGGPVITVLSSKTSQRYRLQSENLPSIWLITNQVKKRLEQKFNRGDGTSDLECSYSSSLPLQEFFNEIDSYFMKRKQYKTSLEILTQRMAQFRSIERRLLTRFKDKTPSALTNLDMLLEGTYKQVQSSCDQVEAATKEEQMVGSNLSCIIRLLLMLSKLSSSVRSEDFSRLESALSPMVHFGQEQGWQETTDAALTFILRTSLAKPGRENQGATPITLEVSKETTRVKKHISSVMDRLTKGGKLDDIDIATEQSPFINEVSHSLTDDEEGFAVIGEKIEPASSRPTEEPTPLGSKFGEAGERIRSAKIRSARSARTRSRPVTSLSRWDDDEGGGGDLPDGPVDINELGEMMPPLAPVISAVPGDIKIEKGIESPLDIFPSSAPITEDDIW